MNAKKEKSPSEEPLRCVTDCSLKTLQQAGATYRKDPERQQPAQWLPLQAPVCTSAFQLAAVPLRLGVLCLFVLCLFPAAIPAAATRLATRGGRCASTVLSDLSEKKEIAPPAVWTGSCRAAKLVVVLVFSPSSGEPVQHSLKYMKDGGTYLSSRKFRNGTKKNLSKF